jgi:hypothetical protein
MREYLVALSLVVALSACASKGTPESAAPSLRTSTARRTNVISLEEIEGHPGIQTAGDLVRQLRPSWIQAEIYLDNADHGDFSTLGQISVTRIKEIRFLTLSEAQNKWGSRVREVIQVISK